MKNLKIGLFLCAIALWGIFQQTPEMTKASRPKQPTPDGYLGYAVFMADGVFDPTTPPDDPNLQPIPGLAPFLDGAYFQEEILGRSPQQIANRQQQAIEYFNTQFGIDVEDEANVGRVLFINWMADPRINYRAYSIGGQNVSSAGREVLDGGWAAIIIDPNGFTLGGEFTGQVVPAGTLVAFGDYSIMPNRPNRNPIVISYRSKTPNVTNAYGVAGSTTEIYKPHLGFGTGQTVSAITQTPEGLLQANGSTILTIPEH